MGQGAGTSAAAANTIKTTTTRHDILRSNTA